MSWSLSALGPPDHLREYVRRHAHHYWTQLAVDERLLITHLIGHLLKDRDPAQLYHLQGSGQTDDHNAQVHLDLALVHPTDLPPPVPDADPEPDRTDPLPVAEA